jgi:hypothetical protein
MRGGADVAEVLGPIMTAFVVRAVGQEQKFDEDALPAVIGGEHVPDSLNSSRNVDIPKN